MAAITRLEVRVTTGTGSGAGTIGPVFVGICRREFGLNHGDLDFTPGHAFTYVFGDGANVVDPADNDPRTPIQLDTTELGSFPRYIRLEGSDAWDLEEVMIVLNPGQASQAVLLGLAGPGQHLMLGPTTGKILHL